MWYLNKIKKKYLEQKFKICRRRVEDKFNVEICIIGTITQIMKFETYDVTTGILFQQMEGVHEKEENNKTQSRMRRRQKWRRIKKLKEAEYDIE